LDDPLENTYFCVYQNRCWIWSDVIWTLWTL